MDCKIVVEVKRPWRTAAHFARHKFACVQLKILVSSIINVAQLHRPMMQQRDIFVLNWALVSHHYRFLIDPVEFRLNNMLDRVHFIFLQWFAHSLHRPHHFDFEPKLSEHTVYAELYAVLNWLHWCDIRSEPLKPCSLADANTRTCTDDLRY